MALTNRINEYTELKQLIRQKGLLDNQPFYYIFKLLLSLSLVALGLIFLVIIDNFWLQLLNSIYLAFAFAQLSFVGHDLSHRQVYRNHQGHDFLVLIIGNLLQGISRAWWVKSHNRGHHANPNRPGLDPDLNLGVISLTEDHAREKKGFFRFTTKYQAYFFFPLLFLGALNFQTLSVRTVLQKNIKYRSVEILFLAVRHLLYFGLIFYQLGAWKALLFIVVHEAFLGLFMASVFAPNHKGMPIIMDKEIKMGFLRHQVITARNIKSHPFTDFWFGGLNYQIEHHLFPTMARNQLKETQKIVKSFCKARSIAYHETSFLKSYQEILQDLHRISAPLRQEKIGMDDDGNSRAHG